MEKINQHRHGGSPQSVMSRLGIPQRHVIDFSVNLNPLGPPEIIKEKWAELIGSINQYPSVEGEGIANFYRNRFGFDSRNFIAGNGSTELIYLVPRVLRPKRTVVITPSYNDYERASLLAGAKVRRSPLSPEEEFSSPDLRSLIKEIKDADALWIGRPNNPPGTLMPKEIVLDLAERFQDKWFIIDEAFIQFVDKWEEHSFLAETPRANILVIHSLTKFYALPGLRLGGIVGSEEVISRLREKKEPWTVNGIAERIAPILLDCRDYEEKTRLLTTDERERVYKKLKGLKGIDPFNSYTNFILCHWKRTGDLDDLIVHLLSNGLYVRDCRNFPGLEDNFFRVGLRTAEDNDLLISVLLSFPDHSDG